MWAETIEETDYGPADAQLTHILVVLVMVVVVDNVSALVRRRLR